MFRALSQSLYKNQINHAAIRQTIYSWIIKITSDLRYKSHWNLDFWHKKGKEDLCYSDGVSNFIYNLVASSLDERIPNNTRGDDLKVWLRNHAHNMLVPALPSHDGKEQLSKYGGTLDLLAFACIYKLDIYVFQRMRESYRWHLVIAGLKKKNSVDHSPFITLHYSFKGTNSPLNHYNAIISDSDNVPKTDKVYVIV